MARLQVRCARRPIRKVHGRSSVWLGSWRLAVCSPGTEQVIVFECDLNLCLEDRSTLFALAGVGAIQ